MLQRTVPAALIAVLLHFVGLSFQTHAMELDECAQNLAATQGINLGYLQAKSLDFPGVTGMDWQKSAGDPILAAVLPNHGLLSYAPVAQSLVWVPNTSLRAAAWLNESSRPFLYVTDEKGELFRYSPMNSTPTVIPWTGDAGTRAIVDPSSNASLTVSGSGASTHRVRIMPVGSDFSNIEIMASGQVHGVAVHSEPASGRVLAAVQTPHRLEIFDLKASGAQPMLSLPLNAAVGLAPQWANDGKGRSHLIYIEGQRLKVLTPGSTPLSWELPHSASAFQPVLDLGHLKIVVRTASGLNTVYGLNDSQILEEREFVTAPDDPLQLIRSNGRALLVSADSKQQALQISALSAPNLVLISENLRADEKILSVSDSNQAGDFQYVAVATNQRLMILTLRPPSAP
jgi:hypothetical protein